MARPTLLDLSRDELDRFLVARGEPGFRAQQIWQAVYREFACSYEAITTLPRPLRRLLEAELPLEALVPIESVESANGDAHKGLFRLADGETIEAVLMRYAQRRTTCLSTQVGCSVGCPFCATGRGGFVRNLTASEIVGQALHFARELHGGTQRLTNIVYMGMGEPFLNYDATLKSIRILNDRNGFALGARAFTVSTVGIVPGIERFTQEDLQANLAISLHAASDTLRDRLVPSNRRYPLDKLIRACRGYTERTGRRVSFEIALIDGLNDSQTHAREVAALLSDLLCHVNLIALNPTSGCSYRPSSRERTQQYAQELRGAGIPLTVRLRRGGDIQAGCGQLQARSACG